MTSRIIY